MNKRLRRGARVLLLTPENRFLLFHFTYASGPLAGTDYWGIPGGGVDEGETPAAGARRELYEETGILVDARALGGVRAVFRYDFCLTSGEEVVQEDTLFLLRIPGEAALSREHFTPEEKKSLTGVRWWNLPELRREAATVKPPDLIALVEGLLADENP